MVPNALAVVFWPFSPNAKTGCGGKLSGRLVLVDGLPDPGKIYGNAKVCLFDDLFGYFL